MNPDDPDIHSNLPFALAALEADGRSRGARAFKAAVAALEADLPAAPGALTMVLLRRVASLSLLADRLDASIAEGRPVDHESYAALSGALVAVAGALHAAVERDIDRAAGGHDRAAATPAATARAALRPVPASRKGA